MAALQTLRNKPALLMSIIGGALLLFIFSMTQENSCSRPNVEGEVNGQELTYEEFNNQVANEENLERLLVGQLSDESKDEISQRVWNNFVQRQVLAKEADKLGLVVTKEDIQNELANVTPQDLQQTVQMLQYGQASFANVPYAQKIMLLVARMMGQPSVEAYRQFMKTADQQMNQLQAQNPEMAEMVAETKNACLYCESQIADEIRTQKYVSLLGLGALSNPVSAKMDFDEGTTSCNVDIASIPYSSVQDSEIKVTDDDLKAKYEAYKELFRLTSETRDLKLINVTVTASAKDQAAIMAQVKAIENGLRSVSTLDGVDSVMVGAKSDVSYDKRYWSKEAYSQSNMTDVVAAIDSLSVGGVLATKVQPRNADGVQYISTYKMVGMKTTPDSMQICQLAVDTKEQAEKIVAAVRGGSTLSAEAKNYNELVQKYGLKGDTIWNATPYYVDANVADSAATAYTDICQMPVGTTNYYKVTGQQGQEIYVVTTVLSATAPSAKYNLAIVKYPIKYSDETYNSKRRALAEFLAKNKTIDAIEKNAAKAGFTVVTRANVSTSEAMSLRYSIGGAGARDPFVWAFDEAEVGDVSKDYVCGKDNDQFLVIAVTGINDDDYLAWDNPTVKEQLRMLVMQDKKAEKIMAKLKNVKNIAAARAVQGVSVNNQPSLPLAQMSTYEPAFAGAVERTAKGRFTGAVAGTSGVLMAQVNDKTINGTFNAATAMATASNATLRRVFGQQGLLNALINKTKIVDKRYKF